MRRFLAALLATVSMCATSRAMAGEKVAPEGAYQIVRIPDREKRHTLASFEAGVIALPNAPISAAQRGGNTPFGQIGEGDATLQIGVRLLYRGGPWWAIGAGALYGPQPTSDTGYGGASGIKRTHSRSYLTLGVEGRLIPFRYGPLEGWFGALVGGVVVLDRFKTEAGVQTPTFLGEPEVTLRTEGLSIGAQVGGTYSFVENWSAGLTGRAHQWFLPSTPACSPIGDCPTLSGPVQAYELALSVSYRIPL